MIPISRTITTKRYQTKNGVHQTRQTIKLIGQAIEDGKGYLPIRNYAADTAARAKPKDYLGQVRHLYDDFIKRWRYVRDPHGLETVTTDPAAVYRLVMGFDGGVGGGGKGAGDCDDAAVAMGSLLKAIGMPVRIVTTAPVGHPGKLFTHVFVQAKVPGLVGWLTVDPVGHPNHGFGWITPHSRIAFWDTSGRLLRSSGVMAGDLQTNHALEGDNQEVQEMLFGDVQCCGLAGAESIERTGDPLPWDREVLLGFGNLIDEMGYMADANHLAIEVDDDDVVDEYGNVRTPMLELSADDYAHVAAFQRPRDGMLGLGDNGDVYEYDDGLGFFKKLRRRVKKRIKRVRRKIRKVMKKTKLGRWAIKIGDKIRSVSMKILKPLNKLIGRVANRLAPIAALIPGYGPAIAGALKATGKISKIMDKYGFKVMKDIDPRTGKEKPGRLKGNPKKLKAMKRALAKEARRMKRGKSKKEIYQMARSLKRKRGGRRLGLGTEEADAYLEGLGLDRSLVACGRGRRRRVHGWPAKPFHRMT